jgi:hypothetical protein
MKKKYVALQLGGTVRGFRFKETRELFYERIIRQLENQGYEVHIFWYTYDFEFDDIVYNLDKNKFDIKKLVVDSDQKIQNFLENDYKLLDRYQFHIAWEGSSMRNYGDKNVLKYGWFKFVNSIKKVNQLRNDYEAEYGINYDWVIMTAPQMEPQNDIDDLTKLDNKYMYSPGYYLCKGFYDSFFIGNVDSMNYVGTLYDRAINKTLDWKNQKRKEKYIDSEPLFMTFVSRKYKMKCTLDIRFHRIRYSGNRITH